MCPDVTRWPCPSCASIPLLTVLELAVCRATPCSKACHRPNLPCAQPYTPCCVCLCWVGGGAVEAALSVYLESFATTLGSREQLAIGEFANAALVIPKTLAVNAAKDATVCAHARVCVGACLCAHMSGCLRGCASARAQALVCPGWLISTEACPCHSCLFA